MCWKPATAWCGDWLLVDADPQLPGTAAAPDLRVRSDLVQVNPGADRGQMYNPIAASAYRHLLCYRRMYQICPQGQIGWPCQIHIWVVRGVIYTGP